MGRILKVERAAGQGFVEKPGAPRRCARGGGADESIDLGLRHGLENTLQDQQVEILVAQGEGEVIGESIAGPVAFVENGPGLISPVAAADILFGDTNSAAALER